MIYIMEAELILTNSLVFYWEEDLAMNRLILGINESYRFCNSYDWKYKNKVRILIVIKVWIKSMVNIFRI